MPWNLCVPSTSKGTVVSRGKSALPTVSSSFCFREKERGSFSFEKPSSRSGIMAFSSRLYHLSLRGRQKRISPLCKWFIVVCFVRKGQGGQTHPGLCAILTRQSRVLFRGRPNICLTWSAIRGLRKRFGCSWMEKGTI